MLNKLFEGKENREKGEKSPAVFTKTKLLRVLLKSNITMGKVKIGLLPSIKNGLAIGLFGAKIRGSGLAISPGFTK
ncbi:MAG: hypothetical protein DLD55_03110 [candidate division SR1 bacterium]|nr:MAG: hypothetical protein DLD55_03110 [candidate division SR1 bacterium]